jgi:alpha-L-fucosidase 2
MPRSILNWNVARAACRATAVLLLAELSLSASSSLRLWYPEPARELITEGLPIGNGRLGALVGGGLARERIVLNEGTWWTGGPYDPSDPGALDALPEVRRRIAEGDYAGAAALAQERMMARPLTQAAYQSLGTLWLDFHGHSGAREYRRELDLETAVTRTHYFVDGVRFEREVFASAPHGVIVMRISADQPGKVSFAMGIDSDQLGVQPWQNSVEVAPFPDGLAIRGRNHGFAEVEGALRFEAIVRVLPEGGFVMPGEEILSVRQADSVVLLIAAATSYVSWEDVSGDPERAVADTLAAALPVPYETLRAAHLADHRERFARFAIDLGSSGEREAWPTDARVAHFADGRDPALAALYVQFGRYLLLASSRPGGQPANLQGIWNDKRHPPWGSKYTININLPMNYWPAEPGNLAECAEPLFRLVEDLSVSGARTARRNYGAGGWVTHHNTDLWRATAPVDGVFWGMWPLGGAWLTLHLWDHYEFGGDREFLARAYPVMRGAAEFFLDTLVEEETEGWLVTSPSVSPENAHRPGVSICAGPTMDNAILRDLFTRCIEAATLLGLDADFRERLATARDRLPPYRIGRAGQLQEWLEDWDLEAPEPHHRHVSHLYGLFPSNHISPLTTPALAAAARRSLELRGDAATGWSLGWKINLWARLHDGQRAHELLALLLSPERTYTNLFDAHPPFQIDGNFGATNGVMEMLLQSQHGELHLLPALPPAWPSGSVRGLRARGGFEVDLTWSEGRVDRATIRSHLGSPLRLRHGEALTEHVLPAGGTLEWRP